MTGTSNDFSAVICFGVPEDQVDQLIEAAHAAPKQPSIWFVVGSNMNRLSGLAAHWGHVTEVVVVLSPSFDEQAVDAVLLVLENEKTEPSDCLWLQGHDVALASLPGIRTKRLSRSLNATEVAAILRPDHRDIVTM
jgi:hypothetical protein